MAGPETTRNHPANPDFTPEDSSYSLGADMVDISPFVDDLDRKDIDETWPEAPPEIRARMAQEHKAISYRNRHKGTPIMWSDDEPLGPPKTDS